MKGTATVLLLLFVCQSCHSQGTDPCDNYKILGRASFRAPHIRLKSHIIDDSKLTPGWYAGPENSKLLEYPPPKNTCGTQKPIYRLKKETDRSQMCYRSARNSCYQPFYIKTKMCGEREIFHLDKIKKSSAFCLSKDPCDNHRTLGNAFYSRPQIRLYGIKSYIGDDSLLTPGWYAVPDNWKLLEYPPPKHTCGTQRPIYRLKKETDRSQMCYRTARNICYQPFYIKTKMCGEREILHLDKLKKASAFCLTQSACDRANPPCANGGTCNPDGTYFTCTCATGFMGQWCTDCLRDILIMEDVSRSIGRASFDKVRQFEQDLVRQFNITPDADNFAYMVFSTNARVIFSLREYSNSTSGVLATLKNQTYESGSETNINKAIDLAVDSVFTPSNGDRPNARNLVIMLTDGFDTETKREDVENIARRLHAIAEVFVVAPSDKEANRTVHSLASEPGNIFRIGSQEAVSSLEARLTRCL